MKGKMMAIMELLSELNDVVETAKADGEKFENAERGHTAAGTRVRKAMQEIKKIANDVRSTVMDIRNERKGA